MDCPEGYREFIRLFNAKKFFEAHEVLEDEWHRQARRNDFYKGLIQLAAAFVHIQRKEAPGALELLRKSRGYLEPYGVFHEGLDLEMILNRMSAAEEAVKRSSF